MKLRSTCPPGAAVHQREGTIAAEVEPIDEAETGTEARLATLGGGPGAKTRRLVERIGDVGEPPLLDVLARDDRCRFERVVTRAHDPRARHDHFRHDPLVTGLRTLGQRVRIRGDGEKSPKDARRAAGAAFVMKSHEASCKRIG